MKYSLITKAVNKVEVVCVCFINFKSKVCILKDPNYNVKEKISEDLNLLKLVSLRILFGGNLFHTAAGAAAILKEQSPSVFFKFEIIDGL